MGWTQLIGLAVLAVTGISATEYDNIPLETSPAEYSRRSAPRPIYTASYGIAPGEYVLRSGDSSDSQPPAPVQGFGFLPRQQAPPQEYLDLVRQTETSNVGTQSKLSKPTNRVIDQQYFGIQPSAPYPASSAPSPIPSTGPSVAHESNVPLTSSYHSVGDGQVSPLIPTYPTSGNSPTTKIHVTPKSYNRKVLPASTLQGNGRQPSGKSVQLTYSLDYDLRTLHTLGDITSGSAGSPSSSGTYSPSRSKETVKGNEELLDQLAPRPQPIPFLPTYDSSEDRKKTKTKSSDDDSEKEKIEVIKLPSPKGQQPISQEELLELIRAGYDVRPADESAGKTTNHQPSGPGYQRIPVPQNSLRLPKTRGQSTSSEYLRTTNTQENISNKQTYHSSSETGPSEVESDSGYYQTPPPVPLPLLRQKIVQPQVQTYQPGTSGIQQVVQLQNTYQKNPQKQPQVYQNNEEYVSQSFPSGADQQQQQEYQRGQQAGNYPTAAAQQPFQVSEPQALIFQQLADPQAYQNPTGSQNEALSQPKEYIVPAPQRTKSYNTRVGQTGSASAEGNEDSLGYQAALGPIAQGYEVLPTAPGATATGGEIQRTQPRYGRRNSRRKPSSNRESHVTYVQRYQGDSTGY